MRWQICVVVLSVALSALSASGCGKSRPTDELIGGLSSSDQADRIQAVRMLPHRKGEAGKVVPALIESLKDKNADVRWNAAIGLGYFGAEARDAIPALEEAERDKDPRVREGARVAISRIKK